MKIDILTLFPDMFTGPFDESIIKRAQEKGLGEIRIQDLSKQKHVILIAGHYEGVDHRVHEHLVDEVVSIGNYVLTGGEIPAMVVTDAVTRLVPGVLEKPQATEIGLFSEDSIVEYPQYTRPEDYKGHKVPEVILSGNHKEIEKWRRQN